MRILRAPDHKTMPWKNGRGLTTQMLIAPEGADLDTFDLRISAATVSGNDPFSRLAGVERTLFILEGQGLRLRVDGNPTVDVTLSSPPFRFSGDAETACELINGPVVDLNVMTRGRSHSAMRLAVEGAAQLAGPAIVICHTGSVRLGDAELGPMDVAVAPDGTWGVSGWGSVFVVRA